MSLDDYLTPASESIKLVELSTVGSVSHYGPTLERLVIDAAEKGSHFIDIEVPDFTVVVAQSLSYLNQAGIFYRKVSDTQYKLLSKYGIALWEIAHKASTRREDPVMVPKSWPSAVLDHIADLVTKSTKYNLEIIDAEQSMEIV